MWLIDYATFCAVFLSLEELRCMAPQTVPKGTGPEKGPSAPSPSPSAGRGGGSSSTTMKASGVVECVSLRAASQKWIQANKCGRGQPLTLWCRTSFVSPPPPRGIANTRCFCFINSVMQALVFLPPFAQLAVSAASDANCSSVCPTLAALGQWMANYLKPTPSRAPLVPPALPLHKDPQFSGSSQSDAHEYLQRLLEVIDAELQGVEATWSLPATSSTGSDLKGWTIVCAGKEKLSYRSHQDRHSLLLGSIMGGATESHLKGQGKNRTSVTTEAFFILPIRIGFKATCTVEDALKYTFQDERVELDDGSFVKKATVVSALPAILILHISRWSVTREGDVVKLENTVSLTPTLTVPASVCTDVLKDLKHRSYRLVSAVAHKGNQASSGHYVAFIRSNSLSPGAAAGRPRHSDPAASDGVQFVMCNDTQLSSVPLRHVEQEATYFLLYQRVS